MPFDGYNIAESMRGNRPISTSIVLDLAKHGDSGDKLHAWLYLVHNDLTEFSIAKRKIKAIIKGKPGLHVWEIAVDYAKDPSLKNFTRVVYSCLDTSPIVSGNIMRIILSVISQSHKVLLYLAVARVKNIHPTLIEEVNTVMSIITSDVVVKNAITLLELQ